MMNNMEQIIMSVLESCESNCLDNSTEREYVAKQVAKELIHQSLEQLASLTGGQLMYDNDGQAVIYTDIRNPDYDRNCMQYTNPFELV
tara:strand:+ start:260 stop:523 length:264 start_codon:yes stop_codon:yes gene_type:complete